MTPRRGRAGARRWKVSEPKMRGEVVEGTVERSPRVPEDEGGRWQMRERTRASCGDAVPMIGPIVPGATVRGREGRDWVARTALTGPSPRAGVARDGSDRGTSRGALRRNAQGCGGLAAAAGGRASDAAAAAAEHRRRTLGAHRAGA
jgi:hypothetical protein